MVLAFLGFLLYALVTPRIYSGLGVARPRAARADIISIKIALDRFEVDNGYFPKSLQDLVQRPADAKNWRGSYFTSTNLPVDPWGNPYIYEYPGKRNKNGYDFFSVGLDGKAGTDDDIVNWTK
jgi:general secretion pathway protein G